MDDFAKRGDGSVDKNQKAQTRYFQRTNNSVLQSLPDIYIYIKNELEHDNQ